MEFTVSGGTGPRFLEGVPGQPCMRDVEDVATILEECLSRRADRVLLYSDNLPDRFFDLSSGEAGAILQKFRTYAIRLAVVRSPGVRLSRRFGEMVAEESRGPSFGLFETREVASTWLSRV